MNSYRTWYREKQFLKYSRAFREFVYRTERIAKIDRMETNKQKDAKLNDNTEVVQGKKTNSPEEVARFYRCVAHLKWLVQPIREYIPVYRIVSI